jgi:DNA-binding YbaB/EbfC family protein
MGKGFDIRAITEMQRNLQERMAKIQEEIKARTVEGSAGGGMVRVTANGALEIVSVHIDPGVIDPEDPEMFEDLVMAATNQALEKARALAQEAQSKVLGGMLPPGMEGMFGL